ARGLDPVGAAGGARRAADGARQGSALLQAFPGHALPFLFVVIDRGRLAVRRPSGGRASGSPAVGPGARGATRLVVFPGGRWLRGPLPFPHACLLRIGTEHGSLPWPGVQGPYPAAATAVGGSTGAWRRRRRLHDRGQG